jgi:hypothetical protein
MRQIIMTVGIGMAVLAGLWGTAPALADEEICFEADFVYTNTTTSEQKLYATLFDEGEQRFMSGSQQFAELNPGATFDGVVRFDIDPSKDDLVLFSTVPSSGRTDVATVRAALIGVSTLQRCNVFTDGRLNDNQAAAPVIVYNEGEFFSFYAVNPNGSGTEILRVPLTEIAPTVATAVATGQNQVITEVSGLGVYALSAGTCQMNVFLPGGAQYVFEWRCNLSPATTVTTSNPVPTTTAPETPTATTTGTITDPNVDSFTFPPLD